jgi:hypothetical protein
MQTTDDHQIRPGAGLRIEGVIKCLTFIKAKGADLTLLPSIICPRKLKLQLYADNSSLCFDNVCLLRGRM